jgi:asparagine synthase (glutamine-hydrolysing)
LIVKAPVADILPRLIWHYDEPFGDASAVPSYAIAELTRQHVTVVLNGDGGDENFAGYTRHVTDHFIRRLSGLLPWWGWSSLDAVFRHLPGSMRQHFTLAKLARLAEVMTMSPAFRYGHWSSQFPPAMRQHLYTEAFQADLANSDPESYFAEAFAASDAQDGIDAALDADVNLYLPDDLLVKMDRATMAHSLEARSPLLDHVLMEYVATLPSDMKLRRNQKKRIFKAALRGLIPDHILDRPKMGFCVPLADWFRGDLREMAHDLLSSSRAKERGYFQPQAVSELLNTHTQEQADHAARLWDLLVLELWHRTFIDHPSTAPI